MKNYDLLLKKIRTLGMDYHWAGMFVEKLRDDEAAFPVPDETAVLISDTRIWIVRNDA